MRSCTYKFTFLELLVIVAIISILLTLLLPSLKTAREQAKIAVCLSNLQQSSRGLAMHAMRNNGDYPGGQPNVAPHSGDHAVMGFRALYLRARGFTGPGKLLSEGSMSGEIFYCPNEKTDTIDARFGLDKKFPNGKYSRRPGGFVRYSYHYQGNYKELGEPGWGRTIKLGMHNSNAVVMVENFASYFQPNLHHGKRLTALFLDGAASLITPHADVRSRPRGERDWNNISDSFRRMDRNE